MSLFFWDSPAYAETHYKFKLPWSLLYRPWPETLIDAPFQVIPGEPLHLWIVVRDADRFPTRLTHLQLHLKLDGQPLITQEIELHLDANQAFSFFPIEIKDLAPGNYEIMPILSVERKGKRKKLHRWNFPTLLSQPLNVQILSKPIPKPLGYIAGETHCHTHYSADPVEFGASPAVLQSVAKSIGLDYVICTDHAYDFAFDAKDYMRPTTAEFRYRALQEEIEALPSKPKLIAGEEISAGNSHRENVHLLAPGPLKYLPGLGDCGRNWLHNFPTLQIPQVLQSAGVPCFAAHPKHPINKIERFIFRRGDWHHEDLNLNADNPLAGIQFWNGTRDKGFFRGRDWWISELEQGNHLLPIGGNDAHGDLNDTTGVSIPLMKLSHSRHHIFGKVRTVIELCEHSSRETFTQTDIMNAFRGDNLYITDGPALWWERNRKVITFRAHSNEDMGAFKKVRLFAHRKGDTHEKEIFSPDFCPTNKELKYDFMHSIVAENFNYVRAECETTLDKFALTSAAFI
ncbi:MAG: hypothetical protein WCX75_00245 [Fibrobacteraceae bacterium]